MGVFSQRKRAVKQYSTHLLEKIELRCRYLPQKEHISVLDAFHGTGEIWRMIKEQTPHKQIIVLGIDKQPHDRTTLKGDNLKFLSSLDLTQFDIIDLDAYGCPYPQLQMLFDRQYSGQVFFTHIKTGVAGGTMGHWELLNSYGYTHEMLSQCHTLFTRDLKDVLFNYLAIHGVSEVSFFDIHKNGTQKLYGAFFL